MIIAAVLGSNEGRERGGVDEEVVYASSYLPWKCVTNPP